MCVANHYTLWELQSALSTPIHKYDHIRPPLHPRLLCSAPCDMLSEYASVARLAGVAHRRSRCIALSVKRDTRFSVRGFWYGRHPGPGLLVHLATYMRVLYTCSDRSGSPRAGGSSDEALTDPVEPGLGFLMRSMPGRELNILGGSRHAILFSCYLIAQSVVTWATVSI